MKKLSGTVVLAMVLTLSLSSFANADEEGALKGSGKDKVHDRKLDQFWEIFETAG